MLTDELKIYLEKNVDKEYYQKVYIKSKGCCVPDEYIGDDLLGSIWKKFCHPLYIVSCKVFDDRGLKNESQIVIDPQYENETNALLIYQKRVLYHLCENAWNYNFDSQDDFETHLRDMYDSIVKELEVIKRD